MNGRSDTDLRAYSGRALLVAAAISSSLHLALALATPEWGGGRGLPMFRRPPFVVRMEKLDLTPQPPLPPFDSAQGRQGEGEGKKPARIEEKDGGQDSHKETEQRLFPVSPAPDPQSPIPVSADGEEKDLLLAAHGGEGADSLAFTGGGEGLPFSPSPTLPVGEEAVGGAGAVEMWEVEEPPKQVAFVEPEYPALARRMGVEGSVVVRYLVDRDGRVEQVTVLEGPELLREACLRAVGQFIYEPVYHRGRRTKVWMRQVVTFRLE